MSGIVVGYDGSKNAEYALSWAMRHAAIEQLPLTVLTINEVAVSPWTGEPSIISADRVMLEKAREAAEDAVARVGHKIGRKLIDMPPVTVTAVTGLAGDELISASEHADMLVIGSAGQREFPALRVSAIGTKVAHYSRCPIVIVPPAD